MNGLLSGAVAAAVLLASPARAGDGPERGNGAFFNRPGATADTLAADLAACRAVAEGGDGQITVGTVLTAGLVGIIGGVFAGARQKRINVENCMLVRGWRLYAMTDAQGRAWKALGEAGQRAELATLVGAEVPARGTRLREWRNDYAEPVLWQE